MIIQPIKINTCTPRYNQSSRAVTKPYPHDKVTFGAVKKSELNPIDLYCAEALKAPLEKFYDKKDFDRWAQNQFYEKSNINDFYTKYYQENTDRITRLDIWKEELKKNLYENNPAMALLIWESITQPLTKDNKEQPQVLDTSVLSHTVNYIKEQAQTKSDFQFCFRKLYENTLRHYIISGDKRVGKFDTKWVKILSEENDKTNFNENVQKLKILSNRTWCTKTVYARTYLKMGDIYIYYDKGHPKACIRMERDNVAEIECENNNCDVSDKYIAEVLNFMQKENLNTDKFGSILLGAKYEDYKSKSN